MRLDAPSFFVDGYDVARHQGWDDEQLQRNLGRGFLERISRSKGLVLVAQSFKQILPKWFCEA